LSQAFSNTAVVKPRKSGNQQVENWVSRRQDVTGKSLIWHCNLIANILQNTLFVDYPALSDSKREIRLIELLPGHGDQQIACNLVVVALNRAPPYEALSYVWGNPLQTQQITVHGKEFKATVNLVDALRHLRESDMSRILWVDAICINQSDNTEKTSQVSLMGKIYSAATRGLVWLGDFHNEGLDTQSVAACFDFIRTLSSLRSEIENGRMSLPPSAFEETPGSPCHVLQTMMDNRWWKRVWTIQEVVFPPSRTIIWGKQSLPWTFLESLEGIIGYWHQMGAPSFYIPEILRSHQLSGQVWAITMYRHRHKNTIDISPLDVFWRFSYRQTSNPCDMIFALLSFLFDSEKEKLQLIPDYSLSTATVFRQVTLKLIRALGNLKPLIGIRGQPKKTQGLPSWTVDWVDADENELHLRRYWDTAFRYSWFSCDQNQALYLETDGSGYVLSLRGHKVGIVKTVMEAPLQHYPQQVLSDSPARVIEVIRQWRRSLNLNEKLDPATPAEGTLEDSFWKATTGGVLTRKTNEVTRLITAADYPAFFRFYTSNHDSVCSCEIYNTLSTTLTNQSLLMTEGGRLGLGPWTTARGDEVWIVEGSRVPLVFRPKKMKQPAVLGILHYTFVGDGYLHEMMHGESVGKSTRMSQVIEVH
jgi:hypothetical protein